MGCDLPKSGSAPASSSFRTPPCRRLNPATSRRSQMNRIANTWAALAVALCSTFLARAEEDEASASLPIARIVLFSSGVGYYQREGTVDGNAKVDLRFTAGGVNDLLKSPVIEDRGGGGSAPPGPTNPKPT